MNASFELGTQCGSVDELPGALGCNARGRGENITASTLDLFGELVHAVGRAIEQSNHQRITGGAEPSEIFHTCSAVPVQIGRGLRRARGSEASVIRIDTPVNMRKSPGSRP